MSIIDRMNDRNKPKSDGQKGGFEKGWIVDSSVTMRFKDGINKIRLVGDEMEIHIHELAPDKFGNIGVADAAAFGHKGGLPYRVPCINWDPVSEKYDKEGGCPFCELYRKACLALKNKNLPESDKKLFEGIKRSMRAKERFRWNVIDREAPYYLKKVKGSDGKEMVEVRVPGFKIADLSFSMFNAIKDLVITSGADITSDEEGVDVAISRSKEKDKTTYTANFVIEGKAIKVTPLTDEERGWKRWDFVEKFCQPYDFDAIRPRMRDFFRAVLDMSFDEIAAYGGDEDPQDDAVDTSVTKPTKPSSLKKEVEFVDPVEDEDIPF